MTAENVGPVVFGVVVGWITYRTLVRSKSAQISDLATVIAAVGGGAVTTVFNDKHLFGLYCIGLGAGFFAYLIIFAKLNGIKQAGQVMGPDPGQEPINIGGE
jgi:hypothetical protein